MKETGMNYSISVQPTPNPNALKFVLNVPVKARESAGFRRGLTTPLPLVNALLALNGVIEVFLSGNFITITQDGTLDWDTAEGVIKEVLLAHIATHNADFDVAPVAAPGKAVDGELGRIDEILDRTIRPALQHDGGDLQVISLEGKTLTISYQGACGCCPHAAMGTLYAIQNILRDQYDPEVVVQMA